MPKRPAFPRRFHSWLLAPLLSGTLACSGDVGSGSGSEPGSGSAGAGSGNVVGPDLKDPPVLGTEGDGNNLEHEQVFRCQDPTLTASQPRIVRLTAQQYNGLVRELVGKSMPSGYIAPFGPSVTQTRFSNYASSFGMSELDLDTLLSSAEVLAPAILDRLQRRHGSPARCLGTPPITEDCARSAIRELGATALRRPLTEAELDRHAASFATYKQTLSEDEAIETVVQTLMASPETVFRTELGEGSPDAKGRTKLGQYEIADMLAFTLSDSIPDKELRDAAQKGELQTAEQIVAQIKRLVGDKPSSLGSVRRFFREYFQHPKLVEVFQAEFQNGGNIDRLVGSGDAFIAAGVDAGPGLLNHLLRSSTSHVSKGIHPLFNFAADQEPPAEPVEVPGRFGMLSQPSWLFAHSISDETDPIHRGKFVYESLLCNQVPDIPIDVVPQLPELENATQRERLAQHSSDPQCISCHQVMDGIGLGLEAFDHLGRLRTEEKGRPVDTRGALSGSGTHDGLFQGVDELTAKLAAAPRTSQCFVRHSFRYWLGRNETVADACSLSDVSQKFAEVDSEVDLIAGILSSDSVLYRKASPQETQP